MTNGQGMEYATDGRRWCVSTISSAWGQQRWVKEDGGHCDCEKGTGLGHSGAYRRDRQGGKKSGCSRRANL